MITEIGIVAGEILQYLENNNDFVGMPLVEQEIGRSKECILMSIGWLAREGYIVVECTESDYKIRLRKQ